MNSTPTIWLAFLAGLVSFVSPCTIPLYPSYISYISGVSYDAGAGVASASIRRRALAHAVFFVLGFSVIFVALGASANLIGILFAKYRTIVSEIGGVIVIVMGLVLLGVVRWDWLMREAKWHSKQAKPASYLGAFVVGVSFAAGWTPCVGPILASVIAIAATGEVNGMVLMLVYAIGFAVPFLILAYTLGSLRWMSRYSVAISRVGGAVLVLMGVMLLTGKLETLTAWLTRIYGGNGGL